MDEFAHDDILHSEEVSVRCKSLSPSPIRSPQSKIILQDEFLKSIAIDESVLQLKIDKELQGTLQDYLHVFSLYNESSSQVFNQL